MNSRHPEHTRHGSKDRELAAAGIRMRWTRTHPHPVAVKLISGPIAAFVWANA